MSSTAKERAELLFHHGQEGAKTPASEYQAKEQAMRELTAKLRAERLAREAKTNELRPVRKPKPNRQPPVSRHNDERDWGEKFFPSLMNFDSRSTRAGSSTPSAVLSCHLAFRKICATQEFVDNCNSVTNRSRRGSFGIRCHRASPRPVAFLGPPFTKNERPLFSDAYCTARRDVNRLSPIF